VEISTAAAASPFTDPSVSVKNQAQKGL